MLRHVRSFPHLILAGMALGLVGVLTYLMYPRSISGDEVKALFDRSSGDSATTWQLYAESSDEYCFKYTRAIPPASRYCVPKTDLLVKTPDDLPRFIRYGELELLEARRPGAARVSF